MFFFQTLVSPIFHPVSACAFVQAAVSAAGAVVAVGGAAFAAAAALGVAAAAAAWGVESWNPGGNSGPLKHPTEGRESQCPQKKLSRIFLPDIHQKKQIACVFLITQYINFTTRHFWRMIHRTIKMFFRARYVNYLAISMQ